MFVYSRKARYHETDRMGIIHHANYIKWMEEARVELMDALGYGYARVESCGIASPVVSLRIDYSHPVYFDDIVELRLRIAGYNGIRLEISYEFYDRTREQVCASASSQHCFLRDGRVVSLRKALPELDSAIRASQEEAPDSP